MQRPSWPTPGSLRSMNTRRVRRGVLGLELLMGATIPQLSVRWRHAISCLLIARPGLDSSVTFSITAFIRKMCLEHKTTVVAALLQVREIRVLMKRELHRVKCCTCSSFSFILPPSFAQPTPEVYALYDNVLLLREGRVVFHGPRGALPAYLAGIGHPPRSRLLHPLVQKAPEEPLSLQKSTIPRRRTSRIGSNPCSSFPRRR